jgi:hypothetical protein
MINQKHERLVKYSLTIIKTEFLDYFYEERDKRKEIITEFG